MYGVRAVANDIAVRVAPPYQRTDTEIAQAAVDLIARSAVIPPNAVDIAVADGWVTLTGLVGWQYQKEAAARAVRDLRGVKGVVNNITLKAHVQQERCSGKLKRPSGGVPRSTHEAFTLWPGRADRQRTDLGGARRGGTGGLGSARRQVGRGPPLGCSVAVEGEKAAIPDVIRDARGVIRDRRSVIRFLRMSITCMPAGVRVHPGLSGILWHESDRASRRSARGACPTQSRGVSATCGDILCAGRQ